MASTSVRPVLIVEDDPLIRDLIEAMLDSDGFSGACAGSGAEAVALLSHSGQEMLAVITDIDLGRGPNGWDVAELAREVSPGLPVIYMSGGSPGGWTSRGVPDSTMLTKPFTQEALLKALTSRIQEPAATP